MSHKFLNPEKIHNPVPFGYSHVIAISPNDYDLVLISGQWASNTDGTVPDIEFPQQVQRSFDNLKSALESAGHDFASVIQIRTYIVDINEEKTAELAAVVKRTWGENPPTHTLVGVSGLAMGTMHFEIEAVSAKPRKSQ